MKDKGDKVEVLTIHLLDRALNIKTSADKANELQKAAQLLNTKMREIRDKQLAIGVERIALMAGLNLAYELLNAHRQKDIYLESISGRIKELHTRLEDNLTPKNQELF